MPTILTGDSWTSNYFGIRPLPHDRGVPLTGGQQGLQLVRILEASSESLKRGGGPVDLAHAENGVISLRPASAPVAQPRVPTNGHSRKKNGGTKLTGNIG